MIQTRKTSLSLVLLITLGLLAGCAQATPSTPGAVYREETVALPTSASTPEPTPVSTRVIPLEALTPDPTPTITPIPDEVRALVVEVLDGQTIRVVMEGDPPGQSYTVRYLGIDAPPNTPSVPWGVAAFEVNRKLIKGKIVRLERDQSEADDEGVLLRYVFLDDNLTSITLVEQGLARASIVEPDTRFQAEILEAEQRARAGQLGLWGNRPPTSTPRPVISPPEAITGTTTLTSTVAAPATSEAEIGPTVDAEATTPESTDTPSPTTNPDAESEEEISDNTATPGPTGELTPGSDSDGENLQGP